MNRCYAQLRFLNEFVSPVVIQPMEAYNTIAYLQEVSNEAVVQQIYTLDALNTQSRYRLIAETGLSLAIQMLTEQRTEAGLMQEQLQVAQRTSEESQQRLAVARGIIDQMMQARYQA